MCNNCFIFGFICFWNSEKIVDCFGVYISVVVIFIVVMVYVCVGVD